MRITNNKKKIFIPMFPPYYLSMQNGYFLQCFQVSLLAKYLYLFKSCISFMKVWLFIPILYEFQWDFVSDI